MNTSTAPEMISEARSAPCSVVLRDVTLEAAPLILRRQGRALIAQQLPSGAGDHGIPVPVSETQSATIALEAARRQGYEAGLVSGHAEGRAHGEALARQRGEALAKAAADRHELELAERAEQLDKELQHDVQERFRKRFGVLDTLIAALPPRIEARMAAVEEDMVALAFEVVCRILGEGAVQPGALRAQVALALAGVREQKWVAVHVHPDDLAALAVDRDVWPSGVGGPAIEWVASEEVMLGGCIVKSPAGGLDARLETQLGLLRDLLVQTRAEVQA